MGKETMSMKDKFLGWCKKEVAMLKEAGQELYDSWFGLRDVWRWGKRLWRNIRYDFNSLRDLKSDTGYGKAFWNKAFRIMGNWALYWAAFCPAVLFSYLAASVNVVIAVALMLWHCHIASAIRAVFFLVDAGIILDGHDIAISFADRFCTLSPPEGNCS